MSFAKAKRPKSRYHLLASRYYSESMEVDSLVELSLALGLRGRATELVAGELDSELSLISRIRLELLYGRVSNILEWRNEIVRRCLPAGDLDQRSINEVTRLLAPVCPDIVTLVGGRIGAKLPCYLAVLAGIDPDRAKQIMQSEGNPTDPDHLLLFANLQDRLTTRQEYFSRYLRAHSLRCDVRPSFAPGYYDYNQKLNFEGETSRQRDLNAISVVMTTFNCEEYVEASLASLYEQTYKPHEIIVVDDASTDGTLARVRSFAERCSLVKIIALKDNIGTYAAKNVGLRAASGGYLTFQDADDWSHPQRFEFCLDALLRDKSLLAVSTMYVRMDHEGKFIAPRVWPLTQWSPNTVFFRRQCVMDKELFMDDTRIGGDSEYVARMKTIFGDSRHLKIRKPLMLALHRPNSLMTSGATGLNNFGLSLSRLDYQELWSERLFSLAHREYVDSSLNFR